MYFPYCCFYENHLRKIHFIFIISALLIILFSDQNILQLNTSVLIIVIFF